MGSNMAEAHPVGFQWVMEAKARGAKVIHIDPRFTRTSAVADTYVPIRAGTDIAFLGGVINYILTNDLDFREYVAAFTNAATLVSDEYRDTEDLDGLFSGYDADSATYDRGSWQYQGASQVDEDTGDSTEHKEQTRSMQPGSGGAPLSDTTDGVAEDPTLQDPRCVFQILKRHFARYTPEMVERVCGTPPEQFRAVCEAWTANSNRERTTALVYSVGWTQHSVGAQYIRSGAIVQLLLGNIGRPGGGVFALRGHASIQGSHGHPDAVQPAARLPADAQRGVTRRPRQLPGRRPQPHARRATGRRPTPTWCRCSRSTSASTPRPRTTSASTYLPRISGDHGTYRTVMDMVDGGKVFGYFLLGQNPAVGSAHGKLQRLGMANLDWVVVRDLAMIESATFWKDSPEIETGEISPETCRTEVFFFPAASHVEKEGTFTQTQRMVQWREKAVEPTGDQRSDLWFFYHLGRMVKERLAASTDPRDEPVQKLDWSYHVDGSGDVGGAVGRGRPAADQRLRRRHRQGRRQLPRAQGRRLHRLRLLDLLRRLRGRGEPGRAPHAALGAGPVRRRVGLDVAREPPRALQPRLGGPGRQAVERAEEARVVGRGEEGVDRARHPGLPGRPPRRATSRRRERPGPKACAATTRSSCRPTARRWLFAPNGVVDGPLPTHYEAHESPVRNPLYGQQGNPTRQGLRAGGQPVEPEPARAGHCEVFPFVLTTARLTEHHTAGGMSRQLPVPVGAAAGAVRRGLPRAGRGCGG